MPVAIQLVGAIGLTSWLAWRHANHLLTANSTRLRQETSLRIGQFLQGSLQAPVQVVQLMAQDSETGRVNFLNPSDREQRLIEYFQIFKGTVDNVAYGGQDGEFAAVQFTDDRSARQLQVAGRATDGKMLGFDLDQNRKLTSVAQVFDPRRRSWYSNTFKAERLVWNSVFQLHSNPQILALPVSQPVRDRNGQVIGVVTSRLYLSAVSRFLKNLPIGRSGLAFVMETDGQLIATSTDTPLVWPNQPQPSRIKANQSLHPVIRATAQHLAADRIITAPTNSADPPAGVQSSAAANPQSFTLTVNHRAYLGQATRFQNAIGLQWWVVIVVPESDFYAPIAAQLQTTVVACLVMLLVVAAVGGWLTQWLTRPLQHLVLAAEGLAKGNWLDRAPRSPIAEIDRLASTFNAMTEQLAQSFQTLAHQAAHDPLTDLPNRHTLLQAIDHRLEQMEQQIEQQMAQNMTQNMVHPTGPPGEPPLATGLNPQPWPGLIDAGPGHYSAILHLDLDDFKLVNDSLGHWVGDQLLTLLAQRLQAHLQPNEVLARFGGDEFTLFLEGLASYDQGIDRAIQLQTLIAQPFDLGSLEIFARVSIGITWVNPQLDAETLLRQAEIALYAAKQRGKGTCVVFRREMHAQVLSRFQMASDLQWALPRRELVLHYQPVVALETQAIQGFEALMRWHHPQRGSIAPTEFIPIAEETGIIVELGLWALREACQQLQHWRSAYPWCQELPISVNCSIRQLTGADFVGQVEAILQETGLPPNLLALEITESLLMHLSPELRATLDRLAILGVRWVIDDFGTGYSSLSYLHQLPLSGLKIDQSFIHNLDRQERPRAIVAAILNLAEQLELTVTAEGAETISSISTLQGLGCRQVQGFFFCPASTPRTLEAWMTNWQRRVRPPRPRLTIVRSPQERSAPATNRALIDTIDRTLNYAAERLDPQELDPQNP